MKDQDADIRLLAAKELAKLGWQPGDKARRLTYLAARRRLYALSRLGGDAIPTLSGLLKDADVSIRHKAALALGRIDDPRALPLLTAAMTDWDISLAVASSLRRREWRPADAVQRVRLLAARRDARALLKDWPKTMRVLLADLKGKDAATARFAFKSLICLGQADTMEALRSFVARSSDEEILSVAAGSGQAELAAPRLRERPDLHNDFRRRRLEYRQSESEPVNPCRWGLWVIEEQLPDLYDALRE